MKKVAVVGYALPSRKCAPFYDPEFEIWGLNWPFYKIPRATRWLEMHKEFQRAEDIEPERYREWLKSQTRIPVYMHRAVPEIPASTRYPKEEILEEFPPVFSCSVCWMLALAIREGFEEIHLYGVHAEDGSPYESQKQGISFLLGVMHGRGIRYYLPPESSLLKADILYGYEERIGDEKNDKSAAAG